MTRMVLTSSRFSKTVLALAMLALLGQVQAVSNDSEVAINVGVGGLQGERADRARFGQYNGLRTGSSGIGILDFNYRRSKEETDQLILFQGSNLMGESRELDLLWKKPGDWKFGATYGELVRYDPNTITTSLIGAGTTTPQVSPGGASSDLDLKVKRTKLGLSFWKSISPDVNFELSLKTENKEGARLFGTGINCPSVVAPGCRGTTGISTGWALLMLPEPINSNHSQVEARLNYAGTKLRLSGGYYGSFFSNVNAALSPNVPSSLNNPVGTLLPLNTGLQAILNLPLALAPDNQAHQLDLTGLYSLTPTTQLNFKLGYSQALQHQNFAASGFTAAPAGVSDLAGKVSTTLALAGITSRPVHKLSLRADIRFEEKDDQTPIALYNIEDKSTYTNRQIPNTKVRAKAQADYQFTSEMRGTLGVDFESIDRGVFTATSALSGISALRQKTDESRFRLDLRRSIGETLSGSIGVESSRRDGSNWLKDNSGTGVTEVTDLNNPATAFAQTAIFMPTLANRQRDKLKLSADWQPTEAIALQLSAEDGRDKFSSPSQYGLARSSMNSVTLDTNIALTETWAINGYLSQGLQTLHQSRPAGYIMAFNNTSTSAGIGFTGKPSGKLEIGGSLSHTDDRNVYAQTLDAFADANSVALLASTGGLPDIVFRQTSVNLFGKFTIDSKASLRVDLIHQRSYLADWTWGYNGVPFAYSDGSTVWQSPNQAVTILMLTYTYKWK